MLPTTNFSHSSETHFTSRNLYIYFLFFSLLLSFLFLSLVSSTLYLPSTIHPTKFHIYYSSSFNSPSSTLSTISNSPGENRPSLISYSQHSSPISSYSIHSIPSVSTSSITPLPVSLSNTSPDSNTIFPILLLTFNRYIYLRKTLESIFSIRPTDYYPLFISQDGTDSKITGVITEFQSKYNNISHLTFLYNKEQHINDWLTRLSKDKSKQGQDLYHHHIRTYKFEVKKFPVYYKISAHFFFGFNKIFSDPHNYSCVVILEDDMELAPDFFKYFSSLIPLFDVDKSLYSISAWNDFGQNQFLSSSLNISSRLQRTNVFPGLGWVMTRSIWNELKDKWPGGFWDEYLRKPSIHQNRTTIYPIVPRLYTFGKKGSSSGQFFDRYLKTINLNNHNINWNNVNLTYMIEPFYKNYFYSLVKSSQRIPLNSLRDISSLISHNSIETNIYSCYDSIRELSLYMKKVGLLDDHKEDHPRCSYDDIISFYLNEYYHIFIGPCKLFHI